MKKIAAMRAEAGRTGPFTVTVLTQDFEPDSLKRYRDLGVDRVIVTPWTSPREGVAAMQRFADEVMPKLA
jgi:hypothetical protein